MEQEMEPLDEFLNGSLRTLKDIELGNITIESAYADIDDFFDTLLSDLAKEYNISDQ